MAKLFVLLGMFLYNTLRIKQLPPPIYVRKKGGVDALVLQNFPFFTSISGRFPFREFVSECFFLVSCRGVLFDN